MPITYDDIATGGSIAGGDSANDASYNLFFNFVGSWVDQSYNQNDVVSYYDYYYGIDFQFICIQSFDTDTYIDPPTYIYYYGSDRWQIYTPVTSANLGGQAVESMNYTYNFLVPFFAGEWTDQPYNKDTVVSYYYSLGNLYATFICTQSFDTDTNIDPASYVYYYGSDRWDFYIPETTAELAGTAIDELSVDGSLIIGGTAICYLADDQIQIQGGSLVGGSATQVTINNVQISSGLIGGGESSQVLFNWIETSGGSLAAGSATIEFGIFGSGGVSVNGDATQEFIDYFDGSGGCGCGSSAELSVLFFVEGSGGVTASAVTSSVFVRFVPEIAGGVLINGFASVEYSFISKPLVLVGGAAENQRISNPIISSFGVRCSGRNLLLVNNNLFYKPTQTQVSINGFPDYGIASRKVVANGGVTLVSQGTDNLEFYKSIRFNWRRNAYIVKNVDFNWNLGQLTMYWYRIVGKGVQDPCVGEPCCQKIVMNVHARSLAELCQKLKKRRYKFPIDTVQRYRIPAETEAINELQAAGSLQNCNDLIDVEVCRIPECADYCVDQDLSVRIVADMKVYAVEQIVGYGGCSLSGQSVIAITPPAKPDFPHTSTGIVFVSNTADYTTNSFVGRGGSKTSGVARLQHSKWKYVGGNWPDVINPRFGTTALSVSRQENQPSWLLPERALKQDLLFTSSDISYARTSQYLVVKNFKIDLPENCKILKFIVRINCLATQSGVRDNEVYLILGDKIISRNLALTSTDWAFVQTTRQYGLSGWRDSEFQESKLPVLSALSLPDVYANDQLPTRDELVDANFGVAISVKSLNPSAAALARIEFITVEVSYEDPINSVLRVSSDSGLTAKSPSYTTTAEGKIILNGVGDCLFDKIYNIKLVSRGVIVYPSAIRSTNLTMNGFAKIAGESKVTPFEETVIGGATLGTEAEVLPWWITMFGKAKTSGKAVVSSKLYYDSEGSINISGFAFTPENKFNYGASGGIQITGSSNVQSQYWKFASSGNVLFVFGEALCKPGNITLPNEIWNFDMFVTFNNARFLTDIDLQNAEGTIDYRNKCGCFDLSSSLSLIHNFSQDNILAKFLVRNNFSISRNLELRYNSVNDSWQNNLHYKGLSSTGENLETWDIVTEIQCTKDVGGLILGTAIWKLALQFFRKNLLTKQSYESRIVIGIIPDTICVGFTSKLNFEVIFDTNEKTAIISPAATLYQNTLFDNIGLFKNRAWTENPNLNLRVSQSAPPQSRRSYIIPTDVKAANPPEPSPFYTNSNVATMIKRS
jgi:hypothetical protein